jgi:hypothetical protein
VLAPGARFPLPDDHEDRGLYITEGAVEVAGKRFEAGRMMVFRPGDRITVKAGEEGARLMALGGATMGGSRFIWWNFVASSRERIEAAKAEWRAARWGEGRFDLPAADNDDSFMKSRPAAGHEGAPRHPGSRHSVTGPLSSVTGNCMNSTAPWSCRLARCEAVQERQRGPSGPAEGSREETVLLTRSTPSACRSTANLPPCPAALPLPDSILPSRKERLVSALCDGPRHGHARPSLCGNSLTPPRSIGVTRSAPRLADAVRSRCFVVDQLGIAPNRLRMPTREIIRLML